MTYNKSGETSSSNNSSGCEGAFRLFLLEQYCWNNITYQPLLQQVLAWIRQMKGRASLQLMSFALSPIISRQSSFLLLSG